MDRTYLNLIRCGSLALMPRKYSGLRVIVYIKCQCYTSVVTATVVVCLVKHKKLGKNVGFLLYALAVKNNNPELREAIPIVFPGE